MPIGSLPEETQHLIKKIAQIAEQRLPSSLEVTPRMVRTEFERAFERGAGRMQDPVFVAGVLGPFVERLKTKRKVALDTENTVREFLRALKEEDFAGWRTLRVDVETIVIPTVSSSPSTTLSGLDAFETENGVGTPKQSSKGARDYLPWVLGLLLVAGLLYYLIPWTINFIHTKQVQITAENVEPPPVVDETLPATKRELRETATAIRSEHAADVNRLDKRITDVKEDHRERLSKVEAVVTKHVSTPHANPARRTPVRRTSPKPSSKPSGCVTVIHDLSVKGQPGIIRKPCQVIK